VALQTGASRHFCYGTARMGLPKWSVCRSRQDGIFSGFPILHPANEDEGQAEIRIRARRRRRIATATSSTREVIAGQRDPVAMPIRPWTEVNRGHRVGTSQWRSRRCESLRSLVLVVSCRVHACSRIFGQHGMTVTRVSGGTSCRKRT